MTTPTIADVWAAFLRLSAAWETKTPINDGLLYLKINADGAGVIDNIHKTLIVRFSDFADALTAIEAARAGLEG